MPSKVLDAVYTLFHLIFMTILKTSYIIPIYK